MLYLRQRCKIMKLNDIFKAINLRVKTAKPYSKDFYGENCREFTFEDCYGNDVGTFIIHPEGDVCQVVVNAITLEQVSIFYRWINPLTVGLRKILLSQKNSQEQLREMYVYQNIPYENIEDKDRILEIVKCVCEGESINNHLINSIDRCGSSNLNTCEISNDIFLKLAKYAYKNGVSVDEFVDSLDTDVNNNNSINSKFENSEKKANLIKPLNNLKKVDKVISPSPLTGSGVKKYVEDNKFLNQSNQSNQLSEISLDMELQVEMSENENFLSPTESIGVKFPNCLNGTFMIGKGFVPEVVLNVEGHNISDYKGKSSAINISNKRVSESSLQSVASKDVIAENARKILKEKVIPILNNTPEEIKRNSHSVHRYPGEKTVLSNLKPIS